MAVVTTTSGSTAVGTRRRVPGAGGGRSTQRVIVWGLVVSVAATVLAFPFEPVDAHAWTGLLFLVGALGLLPAALLLAWRAGQEDDLLAVVGFIAVGLYAVGTLLDAALLARDLPDVSVGMLPGAWGLLALGLILVGVGGRFPMWVRGIGLVAAAGHLVAAVAVLFGAEMPPTGAQPSAWAPMVVAFAKLLYLITLVGWAASVRGGERR